jgi:hypothetical protein
MCRTKHLVSVNSCYSARRPNATRGHYAVLWEMPYSSYIGPNIRLCLLTVTVQCLKLPVYMQKVSGLNLGTEYADRFSVFCLRPYRKNSWGSRRFALRPLHKALLKLPSDAIAQPDSVVNKKNTRIWKLPSFVRLRTLAITSQTTKHCDTDMNTGSSIKR